MASWLDELLDRRQEAKRLEPVAAPAQREVRSVWIQTRAPRVGDQGGAEEGFYFVEAGEVCMCDGPDGKPLPGVRERLTVGGDARAVAGAATEKSMGKRAGLGLFAPAPLLAHGECVKLTRGLRHPARFC